MLEIPLRLGPDDRDDRLVPRRHRECAPQAPPGCPLAAEYREPNRRRDLVDRCATFLGLHPARERRTADAAGVDETLA